MVGSMDLQTLGVVADCVDAGGISDYTVRVYGVFRPTYIFTVAMSEIIICCFV
jgi:hypothetical protein